MMSANFMLNQCPEWEIKDGVIWAFPPGFIQLQLCTMLEVERNELSGGRWGRKISVTAPNGDKHMLFIASSSYGYHKEGIIGGLLDSGLWIFSWRDRFLVLDYIFRPIEGLPAVDRDKERNITISKNSLSAPFCKFWER
jgi:hypothetical protein